MNPSELGIPIELPKYSLDRLPIYKDWFTYKSSLIDNMIYDELLEHWFHMKTRQSTTQIILEPTAPIDRIFLSIFEEVFPSLELPTNWVSVCIQQDGIAIRYSEYSISIRNHSNIIKITHNYYHTRQKVRRVIFNCSIIHRISYSLFQLVVDFHTTSLSKTELVKNTLFNIALELELLHVRRATLSYKNSITNPQENS